MRDPLTAGRTEYRHPLPDLRSRAWLDAFQRGAIAERPNVTGGIGMLDSAKVIERLREAEQRRKGKLIADWTAPDYGDWYVAAAALGCGFVWGMVQWWAR